MRINTYLTYTDRSGVKFRKLLNTVTSEALAFNECWSRAQDVASSISVWGKRDVNLTVSSRFEWCVALEEIDKDTGEKVCTYMWGYEAAALAKLGNGLGTHEDWLKTGS